MSYTEVSHHTTIPTDYTKEELGKFLTTQLNILADFILTENVEELVKLEMGDELLETFVDCDKEEVLEGLQSCVKVVDNEIKLSTNSDETFYSSYFPLTTLCSPFMNKEFVFQHTNCYDSREGMSGDIAILSKTGELTLLTEDDITLK